MPKAIPHPDVKQPASLDLTPKGCDLIWRKKKGARAAHKSVTRASADTHTNKKNDINKATHFHSQI